MTRKAIILHGAREDFREIKKYVKKQFGDAVWAEVNQEFKDTLRQLTANPLLGTHLDELRFVASGNFRKTLVRQSRVVYEFNENQIIVHMFLHTKRDFKTHLEHRLLSLD